MPFLIIFAAWLILTAIFTIVSAAKTGSRKPPQSDDGHTVKASQDLTCETKYGHNHGSTATKRYIVHEDPPEGYVILNGVKRKISDCKYL